CFLHRLFALLWRQLQQALDRFRHLYRSNFGRLRYLGPDILGLQASERVCETCQSIRLSIKRLFNGFLAFLARIEIGQKLVRSIAGIYKAAKLIPPLGFDLFDDCLQTKANRLFELRIHLTTPSCFSLQFKDGVTKKYYIDFP